MIRVIRIKRISFELPAGEFNDFDSGIHSQDVLDVANHMWGKDINNYMIFVNGFSIPLDSNLGVLENRMKNYASFIQ